jgi:hypothetical protein
VRERALQALDEFSGSSPFSGLVYSGQRSERCSARRTTDHERAMPFFRGSRGDGLRLVRR